MQQGKEKEKKQRSTTAKGRIKRLISNGTLIVARSAIRDRMEWEKEHKCLDTETEAIFLRAIEDINEQYKIQSLAGVGSRPL